MYIFQTTGTSRTFVNGGMIIREELQCSNGIIHVLERPLSPINNINVLEYIEESTREGAGYVLLRGFAFLIAVQLHLFSDNRDV